MTRCISCGGIWSILVSSASAGSMVSGQKKKRARTKEQPPRMQKERPCSCSWSSGHVCTCQSSAAPPLDGKMSCENERRVLIRNNARKGWSSAALGSACSCRYHVAVSRRPRFRVLFSCCFRATAGLLKECNMVSNRLELVCGVDWDSFWRVQWSTCAARAFFSPPNVAFRAL